MMPFQKQVSYIGNKIGSSMKFIENNFSISLRAKKEENSIAKTNSNSSNWENRAIRNVISKRNDVP